MTTFNNDATQAERLAALHNATYHQRTQTAEMAGGRLSILGRPMLVGREPSTNYPTLPASSLFASDPVSVEPPLGYEINSLGRWASHTRWVRSSTNCAKAAGSDRSASV